MFDAVKLLRSSKSPENPLSNTSAMIEETAINHLAWLLHSEAGKARCTEPSSFEDASFYDVQVASLAAFLDDARLLHRVLNRSRVRHRLAPGEPQRTPEMMRNYERLRQGAINARVRPFSQVWTKDDSRATNGWLVNDSPLKYLDI